MGLLLLKRWRSVMDENCAYRFNSLDIVRRREG